MLVLGRCEGRSRLQKGEELGRIVCSEEERI